MKGCARNTGNSTESLIPPRFCIRLKKQGPITPAQKRYLQDLVKYHRIDLNVESDSLTKNEASRRS